jgi:Secreted and surface protein containing fasciclin-like repeats
MLNKLPCPSALACLCCFLMACSDNENKDTAAKPSASTIVVAKASASKTIADNIISDSDHTILAKALDSTELMETLKKPGPFTVFTPTNQAFEKLPEGVLESLMTTRKNDFVNILSYHIVAGDIRAHDFKDGQKLRTLAGQELIVSLRNDKLRINGTNVVETDIEAGNGVIHVIDGILFPRDHNAASH